MSRRAWLGMGMAMALIAGVSAVGCSSSPVDSEEAGTLALPLATHGPSGVEYRLRDATFQISNNYYYYDDYGAGGDGSTGNTYTVSSEDDPSAGSLQVSIEKGYYNVRLLPGWHLEKIEDGTATPVEAVLLSGATQWVSVWPHETSYVSFQFGIGDRELWFNGDLNIDLDVYEDPNQYYGNGYGGAPPGGEGGAGGI